MAGPLRVTKIGWDGAAPVCFAAALPNVTQGDIEEELEEGPAQHLCTPRQGERGWALSFDVRVTSLEFGELCVQCIYLLCTRL